MKIFRVRCYGGYKDGSNYYYHADIIAPTWQKAIKAAKQGRVWNWRWIDTYDTSSRDYCKYEFLYRVDNEARSPARPFTWKRFREIEKLRRENGNKTTS